MKDGTAYYFHLQTFQGTWVRPHDCRLNTAHLNREEIQVGQASESPKSSMGEAFGVYRGGSYPFSLLPPQLAITKVTAAYDRQQLWKANVGFVIRLQARLRGFLVRQKFAEHSRFLKTWLPAVIKIQVGWLWLSESSGCPPCSLPTECP